MRDRCKVSTVADGSHHALDLRFALSGAVESSGPAPDLAARAGFGRRPGRRRRARTCASSTGCLVATSSAFGTWCGRAHPVDELAVVGQGSKPCVLVEPSDRLHALHCALFGRSRRGDGSKV